MGRVADKRHVDKIYSAGTLPVGPNPDGRDTAAAEDLTMMTEGDMDQFLGHYKQACLNADAAGFDGVELHGGNGCMYYQPETRMCKARLTG
jgi:NADPH2 dehydrogenase